MSSLPTGWPQWKVPSAGRRRLLCTASGDGPICESLPTANLFQVEEFAHVKNETLSLLGTRHAHASRVLTPLSAAREAIVRTGFIPI